MASQAFFLALIGGFLLFWPEGHAARAARKHVKRLKELDEGASEAFFEERRSLETYPPLRHELWWRLAGVALMALGAGELLYPHFR